MEYVEEPSSTGGAPDPSAAAFGLALAFTPLAFAFALAMAGLRLFCKALCP